MRFKDIPQYTSWGNYACDFGLEYAIKTIEEWERDYGLEAYPDFQRGHVWTEQQQIRYVEFLLRGGRSSRDILFNCPGWSGRVSKVGPMVLVDGLQRLTAVRRFIHNEIRVFDNLYEDFEDSLRMINTIRFHVNELETRAEVLQWYLDLNAGGVVHTQEELERVRTLLAKEKHG